MENLSPAMEDYLKKIYHLSGHSAESVVHVSDLAARMGVSKACTSRATSALSEKGLVQKLKYRSVSLTPEGRERATALSKRYHTILRFFNEILRVDPGIAEEDVCRIEHSLSAESYQSICNYLEKAK
ncbi:MAG: metal-dependent transcriptional regulator [Clostridiales Family XIII bacterium]|jgi:Mn-dependent DtxR family transcriptional regulator|nr:metal-dependent transcriptional regulator [Clostridiales Family XIII bacterium]